MKQKAVSLVAVAVMGMSSVSLAQADEASPVKFSGELAVDVEYGKDYADEKTSDVYVDTFLLNVEHDVNKYVSLKAALLHEESPKEDTADVGLDEAFIHIKAPANENLNFTLGRQYLPFGLHSSNMISDPASLFLSEINDSAATVCYSDGLVAHAFLMNGNTKKAQADDAKKTDHAREFGLGFGYDSETFSAGLDWINSLAEADSIVDAFGSTIEFDSYVPGASLWAKGTIGAFELSGEYVSATKEYDAAAFSYNASGAKPSAVSIEAKYDLGSNGAWLGMRLDQTSELLFLGAPKSSISLGYGQEIFDKTTLAVELYQAKDYDEEDTASAFTAEAVGGSGETANGITMQVGVSF